MGLGSYWSLLLLWLILPVRTECDGDCPEAEDTGLLQHKAGGSSSASTNSSSEKAHCTGHIRPALISVNDGPKPYDMYAPPNSHSAGLRKLTEVYQREFMVKSVRPDEAGLAFDLRCMFPVSSLDQLPDPSDDSNWNWEASDAFFLAIIQGGFAPLLKLGDNTWTSTRISGQAYVNWTTGNVTYVIPPKMYDVCEPWPALAPVINAIGPQLVLKIVERYNRHGALEASKWPKGFAGVELMNEWNWLVCMPSGFGGCSATANKPTAKDWADWCYGPPHTWSSRYWDGTPQMAYDYYAKTAKLIKQHYPDIRVGGPATGFSSSFFPCGDISSTSLGMTWVRGFLENVKAQSAPLDFFTFHYYGQGEGQSTDMVSLPTAYYTLLDIIASVGGFGELPLAITEYNSPFHLGNTSAYVGSMAGAADNAAKMALWVRETRLHAAFLYQGSSGAFEALNPYSFPLDCSAEVMEPTSNCSSCSTTLIQESKSEPLVYSVRGSGSEPHCGCGPQDLLWYNNGTYGPTGEWDSSCNCTLGSLDGCTGCDNYHCQFGPNPQSGMGAVYPDGLRSPSGVLLSMLRSAQGSQRVKMSPSTVATLETKGVYPLAWHRKDNVALLMLSNPSANVIQALPSVAELIPSATRVFRATRLAQFSSESSNVSGLAGVDSTLPLLGKVVFAPEFKGPASKKLQDLQPYDVIKLWILFGGCSNRRYGIS